MSRYRGSDVHPPQPTPAWPDLFREGSTIQRHYPSVSAHKPLASGFGGRIRVQLLASFVIAQWPIKKYSCDHDATVRGRSDLFTVDRPLRRAMVC
jgi:hypothetical protein